ncbi:MAG: hypothetical protein WCF28_10955 [Methanobacterium sp.]|uniref:hypothetical protein n=1 Tax=Methanobacterium sp. TaxID=2164 RepID=UPI003C771B35
MGINKEIESIEIDINDLYELNGESVVKEIVGAVKNDQEIIKIEVSSAIFIHREYIESKYVIVDVIPFHQIRRCAAMLKD